MVSKHKNSAIKSYNQKCCGIQLIIVIVKNILNWQEHHWSTHQFNSKETFICTIPLIG